MSSSQFLKKDVVLNKLDEMNYLDIIIAILLILAFVRGIMKGLFSEIAGLVAIVIGVYVAVNYSFHLVEFLNQSPADWSHQTNKIVGFAFTFLLVVILVVVLGKILTKIADITSLGLINKFLGGLFGALKTALILSVVFILFEKFNKTVPLIKKETLKESLLYKPVKEIAPKIFPAMVKKGEDGTEEITIPGRFK